MKAPFAFCLSLFLSATGAVPAGGAEPPSDLRFSTYLGGQRSDVGEFVVVSPSGSVFVAGRSWSTDFPFTNAQPYSFAGEEFEFLEFDFLTEFAPDGSVLFSTYLTSSMYEVMSGIAVSNGRVVVGWTFEVPMNYPSGYVASVAQGGGPVIFGWLGLGPDQSASRIQGVAAGPGGVWVCGHFWREVEYGIANGNFLALLDPETLDTLKAVYFEDMYGSFENVAVDAAGYIYVAVDRSGTFSMMKLSPDGRSILYDVPLKGSRLYPDSSLAVDAAGRASLAWTTRSPNLPLTAPVQAGFGGGYDAFLVTLDPAGNVLLATYLGGAGDEIAGGITVDRTGGLYLSGTTWSKDFPVNRPLDRPCAGDPICGDSDAFLVHLGPPGSGVLESALLGGSAGESGRDVALTHSGVVAVGGTGSSDFPIVNAFQPVLHAGLDAFVSSLIFNHPPNCFAATASPSVSWPPNGKMIPVSILGVIDPEGDAVALKVIGISQDEPGAAFSGIGSSVAQIKAERDGKGDGRVYRIQFEATDPSGASCTGEVTVCVPHDQGKAGCVDSH